MIKEHRRTFKVLRMSFDLLVVTAFFYFFLWFTLEVANPFGARLHDFPSYRRLPAVLAVCWLLAFVAGGFYEGNRGASWGKAAWLSLKTLGLMLVLFSVAVFAFKIQFISRIFFVVYLLGCLLLLSLTRGSETRLLAGMRRVGFNTLSVLLVGKTAALQRVADEFKRHQDWGYRVVGVVSLDKGKVKAVQGYRSLGSIVQLDNILRNRVVDELVLAAPLGDEETIRAVLDHASSSGVRVRLAMDHAMDPWNMQMDNIGDMPALVFQPNRHGPYSRMVKSGFDLLGAFGLLLLLSPVMLLVGLAILIKMGRPVLYRQKRLGYHGRAFNVYKFRTMIPGASKKRDELLASNEMTGPVFKIQNDPRILPLGAFLRKFSLDELPQLFNVLRGDLSLVGPRPLPFSEARKVPVWARRRYSVKPGITCYWQVMGRSKIGFEDWMKLDLKYVDNWSLGLDLWLLLMTVPAVVLRRGAY